MGDLSRRRYFWYQVFQFNMLCAQRSQSSRATLETSRMWTSGKALTEVLSWLTSTGNRKKSKHASVQINPLFIPWERRWLLPFSKSEIYKQCAINSGCTSIGLSPKCSKLMRLRPMAITIYRHGPHPPAYKGVKCTRRHLNLLLQPVPVPKSDTNNSHRVQFLALVLQFIRFQLKKLIRWWSTGSPPQSL